MSDLSLETAPTRQLTPASVRRRILVRKESMELKSQPDTKMAVSAMTADRAPKPPSPPERRSSRKRLRSQKAKEADGRGLPEFFAIESPRTLRRKVEDQKKLELERSRMPPKGLFKKPAPRIRKLTKATQKKAAARTPKASIGPKPAPKPAPRKRKAAEPAVPVQSDIRTHFRTKSRRLTQREAQQQEQERIHDMLRNCEEPNLEVIMIEEKGKGVVSTAQIKRGQYVCEYSGELITKAEATKREAMYALEDARLGNLEPMCYMYFLNHRGKNMCVDATKTGRIGRLINHSKKRGNLQTKLFEVDGVPRLGFIAKEDIAPGIELSYDYGDRDKSAIEAHPWLAQ